jgi:hypothetical protein
MSGSDNRITIQMGASQGLIGEHLTGWISGDAEDVILPWRRVPSRGTATKRGRVQTIVPGSCPRPLERHPVGGESLRSDTVRDLQQPEQQVEGLNVDIFGAAVRPYDRGVRLGGEALEPGAIGPGCGGSCMIASLAAYRCTCSVGSGLRFGR